MARKKKGDDSPENVAARRRLAQQWSDNAANQVTNDTGRPAGKGRPAPLPLPGGAKPAAPLPEPLADPSVARPLEAGRTSATGGTPLVTSAPGQQPLQPGAQAPEGQQPQPAQPKAPEVEVELTQDRSYLTAAAAWTIVAFTWATVVSFVNGTTKGSDADVGPGPFPVAFVSIAMAWAIAVSSRLLGKNWWLWFLIPVVTLLLGPSIYFQLWAKGIRTTTASYLSAAGQKVQVDVDKASATSATVNTVNGCFAVIRRNGSGETTISVATYQPKTVRQQADMALAPRFASRINPGGEGAVARQFTILDGQVSPTVKVLSAAPVDCEGAVPTPR